ncbi:hypothetical protein NQ318_016948 [Aromia moschata]|uniref:Fas-binding factor 1 C-terminal domain-containing protein n=1 Tax=Aromia moschata TaxID=1265417 RepID=A0AAV8XRW6_9CUCU|nr:hypothetical protein NQ318_016948 [Aromia moschata]
MNFDNDDPLGSDDSFFEEPKALNRKSSLTKKADKKSIENLFNITDTKTSQESVKNDAEGIKKTKSTVTFEEPLSSDFTSDPLKKIQKKNEDWLGISDHTNAPDKQVKKTDFLDDILSGHPSSSRNKKVISFDDILKDSKLNTNKSSDQLKENPAPTETTSNFSLLSSTSKEKRRGRRGSSTPVEDALGLFGDEFQSGDFYTKDKKKPTTSDFQIKSNIASERVVPDWLGGSSITSVKADTDSAKETEIPDKNDFEHEMKQSVPEEEENKKTKPSTGKPETNDVPITAKQQQINKELQSTYASLQQQESLLLISLQLKKYESNLDEVKRQQQEIMEKQEQHFKSLVDQHIMKQQIIDNNVRLQQERINSHIQTLLAHPSSNTSLNDSEKENTHNRDGFLKDFEKTVDTLKQRHHEELFIMEESYKKQIALLEKSTEMLEEKLNNEITTLSKHFEEKINTINRNCNEEISYYKQKIITIEEQHNSEIKLIKENHIQAVEEMKRDHVTQIQYLKEFKQQEKDLLKDGLIYAQKLDSSIEILNSNTKALEVVQDKLINNYDIISTARENSIESKEKK